MKKVFLFLFIFFMLFALTAKAELYLNYENIWINNTFNYSNVHTLNRIVESNQTFHDGQLRYNWTYDTGSCGANPLTRINTSHLDGNMSNGFGYNTNKSNCGFSHSITLRCPTSTPCLPPMVYKEKTSAYALSFNYWYNQSRVVSAATGYMFLLQIDGNTNTGGLDGSWYYFKDWNPYFTIIFKNDSQWHLTSNAQFGQAMTVPNCTNAITSVKNKMHRLDFVVKPNEQTYSLYVDGDCSGCCDIPTSTWKVREFYCLGSCVDREINRFSLTINQNFADQTGMEYIITNILYGNVSGIAYVASDTTTDTAWQANENPTDWTTYVNKVIKDNKISTGTRYIIGVIILLSLIIIWFALLYSMKFLNHVPVFIHLVMIVLMQCVIVWLSLLPAWSIILTLIFGALGIGFAAAKEVRG